jgi:farnesyl-diphosphate farnesyltransferase
LEKKAGSLTMGQPSDVILSRLLRNVSRSFYLTLRALPSRVRSQIGLAYLLARASDTIADTEAIPSEQRLTALCAFREKMVHHNRPLALKQMAASQTSSFERDILHQIEDAFAILASFAKEDQKRIGHVLDIILSGQILDLERFDRADRSHIQSLENDGQLDDYTYRVAGCVGEFWTKICRAHLFPRVQLDDEFLLSTSVRFGKGLQLTNILRDIPADLRIGRCYLPRTRLCQHGLDPSNLMDPLCEPRFRELFRHYIRVAEQHLHAGWQYTNHLPFTQVRVRLACAWPILIGMRTLAKLRSSNVLNPECRVKINRKEVRVLILRSIVCYPWKSRWHRLFSSAADQQRPE